MTGAGDRRLPGAAEIIGAMAVPTRACAPLLVLGLLTACGSDEAAPPSASRSPDASTDSFPAGVYATTITAADRPPSDRLVDDYALELGTDGRYVLEGAGFTASGVYVVDGDALELRDDDRCAPGTVGRYAWRTANDGALTFTAVEQDPCDRPLGGREFVLTARPWAPSTD
jgi:hypothetical protein